MKTIIIGAGPAGLFAANELADSHQVTILEKNDYVGGSGLRSDGKLNFHPKIGGDLTEFLPETKAHKLIDHIDQIFKDLGVDKDNFSPEKLQDLETKAARAGIKFIPIKQRHIGSDYLGKVMDRLRKKLEDKGVKFKLKTEALDLKGKEKIKGVETSKGKEQADYFLLTPGRAGTEWLINLFKKLDLEMNYNPIDIGVRVEIPNEIMNEIVYDYKCWDPKFHIQTPSYDDFVRTFCCCPSGFVLEESYGNSLFGVNGYSMRETKSDNTNFALLAKVSLTKPLESTTDYGKRIAQLTNTLGGGKPILQRLGDLKNNRRSTWDRILRSYVEPTFKDVTPGDIAMAYPDRIVKDMLEGLERLDEVMPGINSDSTLLYAPEIKFYAMRMETNEDLQTGIPNLFVAGDGAGVSRGIVGAAATGIIAARGIIEQE